MDPFETRLVAAATRYGWSEELISTIRKQREQLEADPDVILRILMGRFKLSVNDEVAVRTLAEAASAPIPVAAAPDHTVWEQGHDSEVIEALAEDDPTGHPRPDSPIPTGKVSFAPTAPAATAHGVREVSGDTLATQMREPWGEPLHRAMLALADSVAHAHAAGFVVRNLSPNNVVLGPLGEAVVLDPAAEPTPAYCSPEQAKDWTSNLTARSDVFALGSILFEACTGEPLFARVGAQDTLDAVKTDQRRRISTPPPPALLDICARATAVLPADRYANANDFAAALRHSESSNPRGAESGLLLAEAAQAAHDQAKTLRQTAEQAMKGLSSSAPIEQRQPVWVDLERAAALERESQTLRTASLAELQATAAERPTNITVQDALADHYRALHAEAENRGEHPIGLLDLLRLHDRSGIYTAYIEGSGRLSLRTKPSVEVDLYTYASRERRLWPTPAGRFGTTPLKDVPLPMGSYVAILRPRSGPEIRYPVRVHRQGHWDGVPAESTKPTVIVVPKKGELQAGEVYVAAGWFLAGDRRGNSLPEGPVWREAFILQKHPVLMGEYLEFLGAVRKQDGEAGVASCVPAPPSPGSAAWPKVTWTGRRYALRAGEGRRIWREDWPAAGVPYAGAVRYAEWRSAVEHKPWRLPHEIEWEKAARGVDGRALPWGEHADRLFARYGADEPAKLDAFPADSSPYGVRGMAGNLRDWVDTDDPPPRGYRIARGGCFASVAADLEISQRTVLDAAGSPQVGFRLARDPG